MLDEMIAAGRGMIALLLGRRGASRYFDLTLRGLTGSFVALLAATAVNAYLPSMLGTLPENSLPAWQAFFIALIFYGFQLAFSAIVLIQIKRLDGLMPYVVADNWASFFVTLISVMLSVTQISSETAMVLLAIPVIIIEVNIARLIVTLSFLQIVMFLVAQLVGVLVAIMLITAMLPASVGI